jgi:hypothetical protein
MWNGGPIVSGRVRAAGPNLLRRRSRRPARAHRAGKGVKAALQLVIDLSKLGGPLKLVRGNAKSAQDQHQNHSVPCL